MPPIDLSARIDAAVAAATGGADEGGSGEEGTAAAAPSGGSSEGDAGATTIEGAAANVGPAVSTPAADDPNAARAALIRERLAEQRERRQAAALAAQAAKDREEAAKDREAARGERSKWEALKTGTFREGVAALGKDPLEVFKEMQREAIEASTPEAEIKRMRADFERQIGEKLAPLQETIEALKAEKAAAEEQAAKAASAAHNQALVSAFIRASQDDAYTSLRVEYSDEVLFGHVRNLVDDPDLCVETAAKHGVSLTDPDEGFTMHEILTVLKAVQDAHDQGKTARQAKLRPSESQAAPSASKSTVNGTAERRNAGTTIGPDLAGERAAPPPTLSREKRIQAEIDRLSGR